MFLITVAVIITSLVMMQSCNAERRYTETAVGYGKNVLLELCQFVGVKYIRNPDNPECSYIACWDRTPYNMPCPPGLMVHPLFFWGGNYPCIESDVTNKCIYIHEFMFSGMNQKGRVYGKQAPRDSASETFVSRDNTARVLSSRNLQESVYGGGDVYKPDLSRTENYKTAVNDFRPARDYHTYNFNRHDDRHLKPKPIPLRRGIPYFQQYESTPQRVRSTQYYQQNERSSQNGNYDLDAETAAQSHMTSQETITTKKTPSLADVTTGNKPEETLKVADSASLENATTAHALTAAATDVA